MWFFKNKEKDLSPLRKFVSVRMEAIGGQGANSAGKILAEAAVLRSGFTGNHFSSFGSEKRGTPVRSFVRYATNGQPIRSASFIRNPDVLVILHESLIHSHPEILEGANEGTHVLLNSGHEPNKVSFPKGSRFTSLHVVDASEIARKLKCGINAVILGALADLCWEIHASDLEATLRDYFSSRNKANAAHNLEGYRRGRDQVRSYSFDPSKSFDEPTSLKLPEMGWANAPIGGVIVNPGNSILKDHSSSRKGTVPRLIKEICFNCGYCDMVCPDFCFVWSVESGEPKLQGIDYQYCKGCEKCTMVCPVEALVPTLEEALTPEEKKTKLFYSNLASEGNENED